MVILFIFTVIMYHSVVTKAMTGISLSTDLQAHDRAGKVIIL